MGNFKDFLLKKAKNCESFSIPEEEEIGNFIATRALGHWALDELTKLELACENLRQSRIHEYNLLKDIADNCLGPGVVEALLKTARDTA